MPYDPTSKNSGFTPEEIAAARARAQRERASYASIHNNLQQKKPAAIPAAPQPQPANAITPIAGGSGNTGSGGGARVIPATYSPNQAGGVAPAVYSPPQPIAPAPAAPQTAPVISTLPSTAQPRQQYSRSAFYIPPKTGDTNYMRRGVDFGGNSEAYYQALADGDLDPVSAAPAGQPAQRTPNDVWEDDTVRPAGDVRPDDFPDEDWEKPYIPKAKRRPA